MRFSAAELAADLSGRLHGPDVDLSGLAIDSRLLVPGQLFAAVRAERDGHDFVVAALGSGAAAVLVERSDVVPPRDDVTAIVVDDVSTALMQLARVARSRLPDRVTDKAARLRGTIWAFARFI